MHTFEIITKFIQAVNYNFPYNYFYLPIFDLLSEAVEKRSELYSKFHLFKY